jgi:hypothetical protein
MANDEVEIRSWYDFGSKKKPKEKSVPKLPQQKPPPQKGSGQK